MNADCRDFLKKTSLLSGILLAGQSPQLLRGQSPGPGAPVLGHGDRRQRLRIDWCQLDPARTPVRNCHEMLLDRQGRLIFVTDDVRNNIIVVDRNGRCLEAWGTRWPGGHGLTLGAPGDHDALFIVDCGWFPDVGRTGKMQRNAGSVNKVTLDGRLIFDLGHPVTIGAYEPGMVYQPTEVAVAPNGDIYVADGYGSVQILHYDLHGRFIRKFGGQDNSGPNLNLQNAHEVAVDNRAPVRPALICTSRNEMCFKRFTLDGRYLDTILTPGAFVCRPVIAGDHLYAGVCWSKTNGTGKREANSGFVTILDRRNRVVSNPGGSAPSGEGETLSPIFQTEPVFQHCHDVCVDPEENLHVCQWNAGQALPYRLERVG